MSEFVFAFGSNMCSGRFRAYGVRPVDNACVALLSGYVLVFNKLSKDGSGKANLKETLESGAWGVRYEISARDLGILDTGEGAGYRRVKLPVQAAGRSTAKEAWVYMAMRPSVDRVLRPYTWYKRFLVEGAREHSLPSDYIHLLENIEATKDSNLERHRKMTSLLCVHS